MNTHYVFDQLIFWISRAVCVVDLFMWVYAVAAIVVHRVICRKMTYKEKELRFQSAIDYAMVKEFDAMHDTMQVSFWLELILLAVLWLGGVYADRLQISFMLVETGELACQMTAFAISFGHVIRICAPSCAIQAKGLADCIFRCAKRMIFISLAYGVFYWIICM